MRQSSPCGSVQLPRLQRRKRCQKGYLLNYKVIYGRGCLLSYPVSGAPGRACRYAPKLALWFVQLPRLQRRKRCPKGYLLNNKVIYGRGCLLPYPVSGAPGRACRLCAKARPVVRTTAPTTTNAKAAPNLVPLLRGGRGWIRTTEVGDVRFTV